MGDGERVAQVGVTGASTFRLELVKLDARVDERPGAD